MSAIKPIETHYKGYAFRSRLEARWAVYFDAIEIKWDYEPQGFELPNTERYLPDFVLHTKVGPVFAEVKPQGDITQFDKAKMFIRYSPIGAKLVCLAGVPIVGFYQMFMKISMEKFEKHYNDGKHNYMLDDGLVAKYWVCVCKEYGIVSRYYDDIDYCIDGIEDAVELARSARFEHGRRG